MSNAELNNTSSTSSQPVPLPPPSRAATHGHIYMEQQLHCNSDSSEDDINYGQDGDAVMCNRNMSRRTHNRCCMRNGHLVHCNRHNTNELSNRERNVNNFHKLHREKCVNCLYALKTAGKCNKGSAVFPPTRYDNKMPTRNKDSDHNNGTEKRSALHAHSDTNLINDCCLSGIHNEISVLLQNGDSSSDIGKLLKPKLSPMSKNALHQHPTAFVNDEKYEPLERLLKKLKKCELNYKKFPSFNSDETVKEQSPSSDDIKVSKSFNYTDINERMRSISSKSEMCRKSKTNQVLDDVCALELHRSKTYIIDLIDKALSRELGTIPAKNLNEFNESTDKSAPDQNRSGPNFSMEITAKLTDSIITAESNDAKEMKLNRSASDEPVYIKQLKQLRWTHIRQIQKELKKLEDLDRFLDSYQRE